jgi:hypothetical protein
MLPRTLPAAVVALLLPTAGCDSGPEKAVVAGKVSAGNPNTGGPRAVVMGLVHFWHVASDKQYTAAIGPDGTYRVEVPVGAVKVFVESPRPEPDDVTDPPDPEAAPARIDPRKWISVPVRYQQAESTPLQLEVQSGEQKYDIDLR